MFDIKLSTNLNRYKRLRKNSVIPTGFFEFENELDSRKIIF
jgi:hypothetical protein